jgi:hypothetical protein
MKSNSASDDKRPAHTDETSTSRNKIEAVHRDAASRAISCERIEAAVDDYLNEEKNQKHNILSHCGDKGEDCSCGRPTSGSGSKLVDLVILIDSSGSMGSAGKAVAAAAADALAGAEKECPSDLRIAWFTVDGSKTGANPPGNLGDITAQLAGTNFTQTHQQYLNAIGSTGPFAQDAPQPTGDATYPGEEGADAIADLCNFYDWRPTACKAIFYVSDTSLDGLGHDAVDVAASTNAATVASAHGIVLFAHKIDPGGPSGPAVNSSYTNMCTATGGSAYIGPVDTDQYKILIKDAICKACGAECKEVELPKIEPCVSIAWGDSDCDCFETDDVETAIVSVCNCYSNISFANVHISYFYITMADGTPVPTLPDGTPSVQIIPIGPICFGDIGACKEGETNCVSREVVIRTRGAKAGKYKILVGGICYEIVLRQMHSECFELTLCQD